MRDSEPLDRVLAGLGGAGALLLIISEFLTIAAVDVAHGACSVINDANPALADRCTLSGFERHGGAFKRKDDIYRMAQANKAFAHYRW